MKFNSQICTSRSQSERLLALGLKKETADCMYFAMSKSYHGTEIPVKDRHYNLVLFFQDSNPIMNHEEYEYIPAWSLHRLLCLLPTEYTYDIDFQQIMQDFVFGSQDMYDEVISCIETLIEAGYFYEEYLEK